MTKRPRSSNSATTCEALLRSAIERLSIGAVLDGPLLCREAQVEKIKTFASGSGLTLQLFGMPGTGKTAAVKHALAQLPHISSVFLNGYVIQRPTEAYRALWRHLASCRGADENVGGEQFATALDKRFRSGWSTKNRAMCIIVVDELDKCAEKNAKALFRIVEWLSFPFAHCKLIGIANSMELAIDAKIRSRLDLTNEIVFSPYSEQELNVILAQRLSSVPTVFDLKARQHLCKQTATVCGDVRRLLQCAAAAVHSVLCAIEDGAPVPTKFDSLVEFKHVHAVVSRTFQDRFRDYFNAIQSPVTFLIICVLTNEARRSEAHSSGVSIYHLFERTREAVKQTPFEVFLSFSVFLDLVESLRQVALLELAISDANRNETPVKNSRATLSSTEDVLVTLLHPFEFLKTMCEFHGKFGSLAKAFF